ncbi:DUF4352 domain-containing protein [Nocardiopsis flavescens]|uniref:DUF4352 domain-containing protein n=1 Tax=Nocardiopsis flavescens TaxID=758803 RepID=UPI00365BDAC1
MTDRGPEEGPQERPQETPGDPVNHRPPEEWRPGDPEDPARGGPQPPGEPPHTPPPHGGPAGDRPGPPEEGGHLPPPPGVQWTPPPLGTPYPDAASEGEAPPEPPGAGAPQEPPGPPMEPPGGYPPRDHPTGAPPEPVGGELSEGPNGPYQAGYEHAGYAPGYGESDAPGTGAGRPAGGHAGPPYPDAPAGDGYGGQAPPAFGAGRGPGGGGPPGGYGAPPGGYGPPEAVPTPWGKIIGIGCGVLLLLLLVGGGCTAVGLFMAQSRPPTAQAPGPGETGSQERGEGSSGAEVTAGRTDFEPGPLYTSGDFTSVDVSVSNGGQESLDVNPLYFSVIDASGTLHSTAEAVGMDARELDASTLVPGQSTSGVITVQGLVEADRVVFEPYYGEPVESPVQ